MIEWADSLRFAIRARGVLQHGRPPQDAASAGLRVVHRPSRGLPDRPNPLRQHRGTDGGSAHAPCRVCTARRCDGGIRRDLDRAPDTPSAANPRSQRPRDRWRFSLRTVESLIARLESADSQELVASRQPLAFNASDTRWAQGSRGSAFENNSTGHEDVYFIHSFDTNDRDLQRCGYVLELRERTGGLLLVAAVSRGDATATGWTGRRLGSTARGLRRSFQGRCRPLEALERRLDGPAPMILANVRAAVCGRRLRRVDSRAASHAVTHDASRNLRHA